MARKRPTLVGQPAPIYMRPCYTQAEAARIIGVKSKTFGNWARGYPYPQRPQKYAEPLITLKVTEAGRLLVPFVGLAEAYVLNAFRQGGVSMQRIRPALYKLKEEIGLPAALASRRLKTDGSEILYDFSQHVEDEQLAAEVGELVVVRNNQHVFKEVVANYLTTITYEDEWASVIHLRQYDSLDVIVDPRVNYGRPTLADRGIRVEDIVSRKQAGESVSDLAWDYDIDEDTVRALEPA